MIRSRTATHRSRALPIRLALILGLALQTTNVSGAAKDSATTQARREQLARTRELLADPDPLARLSNLEAIVNSGDGLRTEVALRVALTSDDDELRGLAMRAYLATHREMIFDMILPDEAQKAYDAALPEPDKLRQLESRYRWASLMSTNAGKLRLVVAGYKFPDNVGTLVGETGLPFTMNGDRFSTSVYVLAGIFRMTCFVEVRPTAKATFEGALSCKEGVPRIGLNFQAF